jgi:hypothetical protein
MKLTTGLAVCLAVLVTGLYTWGISTDPDGFGGLIRDKARPVDGGVPLSAVGILDESLEALTWKDVAGEVAQATVFKLRPTPVADIDAGFGFFLVDLRQAVAIRDIAGVLSHSVNTQIVGFEGTEGLVSLEEALRSEVGEALWSQLQKVLALPVARTADGAYCAPWITCLAMPEEAGLVEPFETVFVTGERVPVYEAPGGAGEPLMILSFDALRLTGAPSEGDWLEVALPADRTGFIARDRVALLFGTRADFDYLDTGRWAMTSLVVVP